MGGHSGIRLLRKMVQQPTHPPAQSGGTGCPADTPLFEKKVSIASLVTPPESATIYPHLSLVFLSEAKEK
jgi:hypothetical protein